MLSNRPYLLRAFYQWIVDSRCTPILVVDATATGVNVPAEFVEGGEIVLNVSPSAVLDFKILNNQVEFRASFSGVSHYISAPVGAVLGLYAEENGEGLFLDAEEEQVGGETAVGLRALAKPERSPLRGIDGMNAEPLDNFDFETPIPMPPKQKPVLKLVE